MVSKGKKEKKANKKLNKVGDQAPSYELGREIGIDFPRLDQWKNRFNLSRPRKP